MILLWIRFPKAFGRPKMDLKRARTSKNTKICLNQPVQTVWEDWDLAGLDLPVHFGVWVGWSIGHELINRSLTGLGLVSSLSGWNDIVLGWAQNDVVHSCFRAASSVIGTWNGVISFLYQNDIVRSVEGCASQVQNDVVRF